jgi:hypothetical protein
VTGREGESWANGAGGATEQMSWATTGWGRPKEGSLLQFWLHRVVRDVRLCFLFSVVVITPRLRCLSAGLTAGRRLVSRATRRRGVPVTPQPIPGVAVAEPGVQTRFCSRPPIKGRSGFGAPKALDFPRNVPWSRCASRRAESVQTDCSKDVPTFSLDRKSRQRVEVAGN